MVNRFERVGRKMLRYNSREKTDAQQTHNRKGDAIDSGLEENASCTGVPMGL